MPKRGAQVLIGLVTAVVAVVLGLGAVTWISRNSGPAIRVVSEEGGVAVFVPRHWAIDKTHPTDPDHPEYLNGHENAAFGFLQRGGFWISKWSAGTETTLGSLKADKERQQTRRRRSEWSLHDGRVAGHPALFERYRKAPQGFDRLRLGPTQLVVRELIANGWVFQIGTWTLPHAGDVARQLDTLAQSLEVLAPQPWQAEFRSNDARLTLPGGWSQRPTKLHGAIFFALGPGDPSSAWAYVFHYPEATPNGSVRVARRNITERGGNVTGQRADRLDGRAAVRLDFTFPDGEYGNADDAEWFVNDGEGGTYVVAVGRRSGDERIHARIARSWRFG